MYICFMESGLCLEYFCFLMEGLRNIHMFWPIWQTRGTPYGMESSPTQRNAPPVFSLFLMFLCKSEQFL